MGSPSHRVGMGLGLARATTKPLLFIDVDGVLNRYRAAGPQFEQMVHHIGPSTIQAFTYRMVLDPANGPKLLAMTDAFDLAWGTTWEHDANLLIAPIVGLPNDLPVAVTAVTEHSKAPGVARLAGGRPFVWLDDDLDTYDRSFLTDYPASWLIVDVDPNVGLTDENLAQARQFAEALADFGGDLVSAEHPTTRAPARRARRPVPRCKARAVDLSQEGRD